MTDLIRFLIVALVLYLCECFQKTGPAALVFLGSRRLRPNLYPGNGTWGWIFANPFRPFQAAFAVNPPMTLPTPEGVLPNPRYSPAALEFGGAAKMERVLAAMVDETAFANRLALYRKHVGPLRLAALALAVMLVLVWPVLAMWLGFAVSLGIVVVAAYAIAGYGAWRFRRAYAELYPDRKADRFSETLKFALYPFTLLRGADHLAAHLFDGFDRSLAVRHFAPKAKRAEWYGELLREAAHPPTARMEEREAAAARKFYAAWHAAVRKVAEADGVKTDPRAPESAAAWCPVCLTEFQSDRGACDDCGGVPLAVRQ